MTFPPGSEPYVDQLLAALREARPYVFNRIDHAAIHRGEEDWRSQTARAVLERVDAALGKREEE